MPNKNTPVGILGGGISGLSIAYALAQKGISAAVYEKADEVGGAIRTIRKGGWMVEEGPNTLSVKSTALWELFDELGLQNQIVKASPEAQKRFVVKDNRPEALPRTAAQFLRTPLLSTADKFRLLKEPFIPASTKHDESVAAFIRRRLGQAPLDYGVNPFVSGVYAGDPKSLSVKHTFSSLWQMEHNHCSLLKGMFKQNRSEEAAERRLIAFKEGNQQLPRALEKALPGAVRTSAEIQSVEKENGRWLVKGAGEGGSFETGHNCLISTVPAHVLPRIFDSDLFEKLAELPYASLSVLALGFEEQQISHPLDGFGMLVPEVEGYQTLGALFSSTLFPHCAPEGHKLLTCFIGGERHPRLASKPKEELQSIVLEELNELLGITGKPTFTHHNFWPRAIPQYEVGYDYYLSLMKDIEKEYDGLYLDGNFRGGVSVPDCISAGFETAHKAATFLRSVL